MPRRLLPGEGGPLGHPGSPTPLRAASSLGSKDSVLRISGLLLWGDSFCGTFLFLMSFSIVFPCRRLRDVCDFSRPGHLLSKACSRLSNSLSLSSFPLPSGWPTHALHPSHPCHHHWSLPADVPYCPPAQHHLSIPQGTLDRVRKVGKRPTETDHLAARQPQKRDIQTKEVFCSSFLKDQINLSPNNDDKKSGSGKFSFLSP